MQERYTPDIETEPLHVEVMVSVFHDQISESGKKEKEIAMLKFGNSGLRLKYIDRLDRADDLHSWEMHFTPEHQSDPPIGRKKIIRYPHMFAAGFVSMVNTLVSGKLATYSELSGILAQHPLTKVSFQTNDRMWDFACKCVGKKYFIKIPQDFSTGNPKLHESIKGIFDNKGWPGEFFLADFLADYRADPSILERCKKLADPKKLENLRVNS